MKWSPRASAVFDAPSNKKRYLTLCSTVVEFANTLSNLSSEKNAQQHFEMPDIRENVVFCEYLCKDE